VSARIKYKLGSPPAQFDLVLDGVADMSWIFHGYNPYGPSGRFTSRYQAWLRIREPGTYRFGTISDDASALWIDEQPVADWPGGHNVWQRGGHRFRHNGSIELAAGLHRLEYLHVQAGSATACVAAWLPPGAEKPVPIPAEAFAPVTPYRADGLGDGPLVAWRAVRHNAWRDHLLVTMELTVTGIGEDTEVRWRSDDGATHRGHRWRHVFLRPGLRLVTLTLEPPGGGTTTIEQAVRVGHAHFQRHQFDDEHFRTQREAVMGRDFAGLDGADRAELVTLALRSRDRDWLAAIAERLAAVDGLGGVEAAAVLDLAIAVQHPELQRYETAIALFEGLRDGQQVPPGVRAAAALHQAGLLIQILGRPAEGRELLEALDHEALSGGDRRLARIYRADADLYAGRSDAALRRYRQVGTTTHDGDLGYAVTRRIRLEMARDYIRRGAADAAEEILRSIEWETPEERMGGELVELQAEVWLLRGEWRFALARLPAVIAARREDPRLPELLLLHLRALLAADRREDAEAVAAELRRDYPLSEASARIAHHLQSAAETAE